jgi:hypothetical protein
MLPTKHAVPMLGHPPRFSNEPNTSLAGAFGANTHNGTMMQKKPKTVKIRTTISRIGRNLAPTVFMSVPKIPIKIMTRLWCQFCMLYAGLYIEAIERISTAALYAVVAIKACQPNAASQPTM